MRLNLSQYTLPSGKLALSSESPDALDTLKVKLRAEQQPANETEEILVNEMAEQFWRLRRARAIETSLLDSDQVLIPHLTAIQGMMSSAERGFHKALTVLRQLQKDRGFVPQKQNRDLACQGTSALAREGAASGFVPQSEQNPDCQGGVKLTATEPRPKEAVGFVPPPCPKGEDIDPADWARAFAARHRVHTKMSS
ncbi:MAG TPA: hypothetical protein VFB14_24480 [Bryobacteraceae bacterium]|nr:hypothetical protein [Bryobacteraceae bacterium]